MQLWEGTTRVMLHCDACSGRDRAAAAGVSAVVLPPASVLHKHVHRFLCWVQRSFAGWWRCEGKTGKLLRKVTEGQGARARRCWHMGGQPFTLCCLRCSLQKQWEEPCAGAFDTMMSIRQRKGVGTTEVSEDGAAQQENVTLEKKPSSGRWQIKAAFGITCVSEC